MLWSRSRSWLGFTTCRWWKSFFFSSRRRHTRLQGDWSSDVCSSDLGTTQFAWDFENRLTQVVTPSSGSVSYKYDALGRRIQRTGSDGVQTNFTYDGQDVMRDVNNDGSTVDYLNGPGIDNKIRQTTAARKKVTALYFATDHLGSTTALTNDKGHVVDEIT